MDAIRSVVEAAERDAIRGLELAIPAWAGSRDATLATAIRTLTTQVLSDFPGPRAAQKQAFHEGWLATADRDPSAVATGWLAANLGRKLPITSDGWWTTGGMALRYRCLFDRFDALRARCPDPRIAGASVAFLRRGKHGYWDEGSIEALYRPLVRLLVAAGDPSAVDDVAEIVRRPRSRRAMVREWPTEQLPSAIVELGEVAVTPLDEASKRALAPWSSGRDSNAAAADAAALLEEVLAHPDDDSVRAVLADILLIASDPRGTLIARQLEGADGTEPDVKRLIRAHGKQWLGPDLAAVLMVQDWRLGFPDEASLRKNAVASDEVCAAAYEDPRMATIRTLRQGTGNRRHYEGFVTSEASTGLRRIEVPTNPFAEALAKAPAKALEALEFARVPSGALLARLANAPSCAEVHTISLPIGFDPPELLKALAKVSWRSQLRVLEMQTDGSSA